MLSPILEHLDLADCPRQVLVDSTDGPFDFGESCGVGLVLDPPRPLSLDTFKARTSEIVVATGERTLAVCSVTLESDDVQAVRSSVSGRDMQVVSNDGRAKDLEGNS